MTSRIGALVVATVFLTGVWFHGLTWGLSHDEGVTVDVAVGHIAARPPAEPLPLTSLYDVLDGSSPHGLGTVLFGLKSWGVVQPPAYYILLNRWVAAAGGGRVMLRLPGVLCGLVALLGLQRLGRRLTGRASAGTWAALILAASPWFLTIASFARPYALALALATWTTHLALDWDRGRAVRAAFVLLSIAGVYTLYHHAFVLAWQLGLIAWGAARSGPSPRARAVAGVAAAGVLVTAAFLPWLPVLRAHLELTGTTPSYYLGAVEPAGWVGETLRLLSEFALSQATRGPLGASLGIGLAALTAVTLPLGVLAVRRSGPAARRLWLAAPLYPALIAAADAMHGTRTVFITKTCMLLAPLLAVFVAGAWTAVRRPLVRRAGLTLWLALPATATATSAWEQSGYADHHAVVAEHVAHHDSPRHRVVVSTLTRGHGIPLLLTMWEEGVREVELVRAPSEDLLDVVGTLLDDPGVERATLLNLTTTYERGSDPPWPRELLVTVSARAREAGWRVKRTGPAALPGMDPLPPPAFVIVNPVR